ncbi:MAG: helix-turn-helix domain-containing protein [Anaerotruncus sp.]|jgi:repressor LexA|nr:helix-turn-helix domain-containing protein [Anaerotruncus sp.]
MLGERLKQLRKQNKISQMALASQLGLSQQAVGKWETERSAPDPATLNQLADIFQVSVDYLLGRDSSPKQSGEVMLPILGTVKAGYGAMAFEEYYGQEPANVRSPEEYFYLLVHGDSMEPQIRSGDLALVHRQPDVQSGELAVVLVDGEEGTLKRVIKKDQAVILQAFNQMYEAQVFIGQEIERLTVIGKVVETKTKW